MSRITPLAAYSARIKELYIELDHYAFFHGPSEVDRIDRRFTGRREVLDRLKSLLTDHESPAGAYLVTGFRGAGKSSLVARALSEIMAGHWEMISARRALRIVSPVIGSALLPTPWPVGVLVFLVGIAVIAVAGLAVSDPDRHDRVPASHRRRWAEWAQTARRALILRREPPPVSRFRTLVKDLVAILILVLLSQMIFGLFAVYGGRIVSPDVIVHRLAVVGLLAAVHVGLVSAITELAGTGLIDKAGRFLVKVRQALASRRWVHVKINLSQDNLQEIDILRSIASSLESEYRRFARPSFRRIVIRSLLLLPFLLIAALIYQTTLFHWAQDVKHDLHIACALPSQALYDPADLQNAEPRSPRASGTFPELTLQSVDRQPVFSTLDTYQMVLRHHRVGLAVGTDELRRALDRRLREQRSRFGIATTHGILHETPEGALGELYATFFLVTTEIDTLIQLVYGKVVTSLTPPWATSSTDPLPPTLDYALVLFLVLGWIVPVRLMRWSVLDRPSHRDILRQVRDLNDMIASEVTHEQGGVPFQASSLISLSFGRRQRQTYRNLNEREIEKRLIDILWHSQRVSPLEIRPEFVVVFDELDKIQHTPVDQGQATDTGVDASKTPDLGPVDVVERNRQHRILSLVSNLKHFLSTAPAKFIFIAGREMFDAALADVSDRHFFMGSVFNEVLHVPSFHSDASDERLPDITSLPEEVLCRFLLPRDFSGRPSLAAFREHLERHLLPAGGPCPTWLLDQQRHKVMYELHNFVTYLTYRSNGAPKRITATLERFIVRLPDRFVRQTTDEPKPSGDYRDPHHLVVGRSSRSLYLRFRYADQYTFGLVTYLASPLIFSVNRAIKDYGDKILVSSAFVLDHIFKFHGHGFSWRNLELLPDVVDINRAPQLRELISHIMRFLSRGHINEIISGLYRFKFTRRISEEINFLSKLSEHESAAFNFTLDESLNLKRRFYRQLNRLLETHSRYPDGWSDEHDFVHSVAFLRMILGDLHYYDGEYDSAIVEYMEAVQQLRRVRPDERADTLVLMIRNFLKLGLTYERKKTFDSALVTYGRIAAIVQEFGRRHLREGSDTAAPTSAVDSLDHDPGPATLEGHRLIFQPMFARLQSLEKATMGGISPRDLEHVQRELDSLLGPEQQEKRFLATSEFYNKVGDILFFKNGPMPPADAVSCRRRRRWRPGGAVRRGLSVLSGERRDKRSAPRSPILLGFANPHQEDLVRQRRRLPCAACGSYNNALLVMCRHFLEIPEERLREPGQVLISILQSFEPSSEATARTAPDRRNFLFELGDLLSDLGDTYIGCAYVPSRADRSGSTLDAEPAGDAIPAEALTLLVDLLREDRSADRLRSATMRDLVRMMAAPSNRRHVKVIEAAAYFAVAAILFRAAAHHRAASIQIIKLLWLLREVLALTRPQVSDWQPATIEALVRLSIRELHRSHEGTHRLEIERIKELLDPELDGRCRDSVQVDLSRISINANITEVLVLQREMEMLLPGDPTPRPLDDICSPHGMFPSVYSRIHALRLRSGLHRHNLRVAGLDVALGRFKATDSLDAPSEQLAERVEAIERALARLGEVAADIVPDATAADDAPTTIGLELLEMMLVDAAYCNHEIIRLLQIYGRSYMASHSMKASAHAALCRWCNHLFATIRYREAQVLGDPSETTAERRQDDLQRFQRQLEHAFGKADMVHLSPNYHREMALRYWRAAAETHSEGRAYKELLEDMYYLNDDFSDFLEHFCAAIERLRLNSGFVDGQIDQLTHELSLTSIYEPRHYFEPRRGGSDTA